MAACFHLISPLDSQEQPPERVHAGHRRSLGSWPCQKENGSIIQYWLLYVADTQKYCSNLSCQNILIYKQYQPMKTSEVEDLYHICLLRKPPPH